MTIPSQGLVVCKECGLEKPRYTPNPHWRMCVECGKSKQAEYTRAYRKRLGDKYRERMVKRYHDNIANMTPDELANFRQKEAAKTRKRVRALKEDVFNAYGGYICACCGVKEPMFLSLDHINNDGNDMRKEHGKTPERLYRWIVKNNYPKIFQVLCMNCNTGKHRNGGTCPHQTRCNDYP